MSRNPYRSFLIGKQVQWRLNGNDDWKNAVIEAENQYTLNNAFDDQEQNTVIFQQSKVFPHHVDIELLDCAVDDDRRFRAYAVLDATIYPVERNEKPQWHESEHDIAEFPIVVVDDCAYVIAQILEADDEDELKCEQPDLAILLTVMFQLP